jgi:large subunit ribosomal protein L21
MYAVIATGGKQEKVSEGQVLDIERLVGAEAGGTVAFTPILLVDGSSVISSVDDLASAKVEAEVVGEIKGKKIRGFTYKNKSNQRKRWGHRQKYLQVKITSIKAKG